MEVDLTQLTDRDLAILYDNVVPTGYYCHAFTIEDLEDEIDRRGSRMCPLCQNGGDSCVNTPGTCGRLEHFDRRREHMTENDPPETVVNWGFYRIAAAIRTTLEQVIGKYLKKKEEENDDS